MVEADWSIDLMAYPDVVGLFLRGMIGPDTCTPGVSTTLSATTTAGATSITTAATIPLNSYIMIDSGANLEYAKTGTPSGAGPYTIPVTGVGTAGGLQFGHTSGAAIVAASTHVFKQSSVPSTKATYSLTVYDTTQTISYSGGALSDLDIKIDPKGAVTLGTKLKTFPFATASAMTPAFTQLPPALGWEWAMTNSGASSTRGLTYDLKLKRKLDVIHSSNGIQAPREIFQGAIEVDGTYKAIFENQTDMNTYINYLQTVTTATMQQPIAAGGGSLALTMSKSGWIKGKREWQDYVEASFAIAGIYNATDGGAVQATLTNFASTAY